MHAWRKRLPRPVCLVPIGRLVAVQLFFVVQTKSQSITYFYSLVNDTNPVNLRFGKRFSLHICFSVEMASNPEQQGFLLICVLKVASEKSPIYSNHEPGRLMVKSMVRISFNVVFIRLSIIMRRYLTWCTMRLLSKQPPDILIFQNFAAEGASSRSLPTPTPPSH